MPQYKTIWNEVESQLFGKLTTEPIKAKHVHGKLKMWKERIKTNFHGQDVPYDMYCNATAVLNIDSVYKQGKNYYPQVHVEEYKYTVAENRQCNRLSNDDNDDGFFEVLRGGQKILATCPGATKLIINEQDIAVRACIKVDYTSSKLYESKGRA